LTKLIRIYFLTSVSSYLKKKKKKYHKILYNIVKNLYINKKNRLVNKRISSVKNMISFFNSPYGMNLALFNIFFKKFTVY